MSDQSQGPGWWQASDAKWYPPDAQPAPPPPPSGMVQTPAQAARTKAEKLILGGCAAVAIGAFLPWASVGPFTKNGTDGDGSITLVLALVAGWLTWTRKAPRFVGVVVLLTAVIGIYDMADVSRLSDDSELFTVTIGFGLVITVAGAVVGLVGWVMRRRDRSI